MAEVIRKTESKFPGPWLLDGAGLAALDEIIDEQWSRLEAYKMGEIEVAVRAIKDRRGRASNAPNTELGPGVEQEIRQRAHQDYRYSGDGRVITLTLKSGNKILVNSFREAMNDANCQDHEITKVEIKLYCGALGVT